MILMHANDLLDWRIIEEESFVPNMTISPICCAISEMIDLMNATLVDMNLTIKKLMSKQIFSHAKFDKRRLQQVLLNLLSNAVKYSKTGTIQVIALTSDNVDDNKGTQLVIKVID